MMMWTISKSTLNILRHEQFNVCTVNVLVDYGTGGCTQRQFKVVQNVYFSSSLISVKLG